MAEYVIGTIDEFPPGKAVAVQAGRLTIALFRVGDEFFAINNRCPHKGASLCEGEIVEEVRIVRCPWHHWNWRLDDGTLESDPRQRARVFEITVDGEEVVLRIRNQGSEVRNQDRDDHPMHDI
jgi:NAD(P)H-dependent nitrite reductase small subunit